MSDTPSDGPATTPPSGGDSVATVTPQIPADAEADNGGEEAVTPAEESEQPEPADELREGLLAALTDGLGDNLVGSHISPGRELWVRVAREAWIDAAELAKVKLGCTFFDFLSAIDWMRSPWGRYEYSAIDLEDGTPRPDPEVRVETGVAGGDQRFQVFTRVVNIRKHYSVIFKADIPEEDLRIATLVPFYAGANWHERECWEMFGIIFDGHPSLRHLYLPGSFEGHPLRKDFPLLARLVKPWPGIVDVEPMPAEAEADGEEQAGGESPAGDDAAEAAETHGESHSTEGGAGADRGGDDSS